jgi:hypothetical protein
MNRRAAVIVVLVVAFASLALASPDLAGRWIVRAEGVAIDLDLKADGTFDWMMRTGQSTERLRGTWRVGPESELLVTPEGDEPLRVGYRLVDRDTLELTVPGEGTYRLERARDEPPPEPPEPPENARRPIVPLIGAAPRPWSGLTSGKLAPASGRIAFSKLSLRPVAAGIPPLPISQLYTMAADGSDVRPLLTSPGFIDVRSPCWMPGGRHLLFSGIIAPERSACFADSFVADTVTGAITRISGSEWSAGPVKGTGTIVVLCDALIRSLRLTPEGRSASEMSRINIVVQGMNGQVFHPQRQIEFVDDDNQTFAKAHAVAIPNVPAGKVWVRMWVTKHIGALKIVDLAPGAIETIGMNQADGNFLVTNPSVTPDGRYMAALSQFAFHNPRAKVANTGHDTIVILDTRTGACVAMWDAMKHGMQTARDPKISPDGKWLAFGLGDETKCALAVCTLESFLAGAPQVRVLVPHQTALAQGWTSNRFPSWSPDSKRIAFSHAQVGNHTLSGNLAVVNLDGSGARPVTRLGPRHAVGVSSWSPDGSTIAFQVVTSKRQVMTPMDLLTLNITSDICRLGPDGKVVRLTSDGASCDPAWQK